MAIKKLIVDLEKPQKIEDIKEIDFQNNIRDFLIKPIHEFLSACSENKSELGFEKRNASPSPLDSNYIKYTDTAIYYEGTNKMECCYEFKQFPIIPEFYGPDGSFDIDQLFCVESMSGKNIALKQYVKQLELEIMIHRINRGILSDSYTFIFIEVDLERF